MKNIFKLITNNKSAIIFIISISTMLYFGYYILKPIIDYTLEDKIMKDNFDSASQFLK